MRRNARVFSCLSLALGCTRSGPPVTSPSGTDAPGPGADATEPQGVSYPFQATTRSPQAPDQKMDDFARGCPRRDAALERAARYLASHELAAGKSLDAEDVTLVLRAE